MHRFSWLDWRDHLDLQRTVIHVGLAPTTAQGLIPRIRAGLNRRPLIPSLFHLIWPPLFTRGLVALIRPAATLVAAGMIGLAVLALLLPPLATVWVLWTVRP